MLTVYVGLIQDRVKLARASSWLEALEVHKTTETLEALPQAYRSLSIPYLRTAKARPCMTIRQRTFTETKRTQRCRPEQPNDNVLSSQQQGAIR